MPRFPLRTCCGLLLSNRPQLLRDQRCPEFHAVRDRRYRYIRYADGSVVKTKVGHKDAGWDLALLIPQTGRWLEGLVPSAGDPGSGVQS